MKKILFVHRSVGRNLLEDSNFYSLLEQSGADFEFHDYDHNTGELFNGVKKLKLGISFEGGNTDPKDYAQLFSDEKVVGEQKRARDLVMAYDIIIIKSCYPNSHIASDGDLDVLKSHYHSIADFFARHPDKHLLIMTSPPLIPRETDAPAAARARLLSSWLSEARLGRNISVFNLYNLLAEPEGNEEANMLRRGYRRRWPWDSHPNKKAAQDVAPALIGVIEDLAKVDD